MTYKKGDILSCKYGTGVVTYFDGEMGVEFPSPYLYTDFLPISSESFKKLKWELLDNINNMNNREDLINKRYCQHCGTQLIKENTYASDYSECIFSWGSRGYSKYCKKTGKRFYIKHYRCPKYSFFSQNHDKYSEGKPFTEK